MAYPWIFESNFEGGTNGEWDSESDTGSKLDIAHYTQLARYNNSKCKVAPYRGAYCMRIDLSSGDTNDHVLVEGDIDIADAGTSYFRWYMYVSDDFTATADDVFNIFELQQAGGTNEMSTGMRITAATNVLEIGVGDGTSPSSYVGFPRGRWVCVELKATVSTGGAGTMDLYLDGGAASISLTTLTQAAAVGRGVLGTQDTLSTTSGVLLFDQFVQDDARIYPFNDRWPMVMTIQKTQHVFVGPGDVDAVDVLSADGNLTLYDTDNANINDAQSYPIQIDESTIKGTLQNIHFEKGCYAVVAGTNPVVNISLMRGSDRPGFNGPTAYGSDGAIRSYAARRKPRAANG